jgi:large subunit ribosomal protein L13
MNILKTYFPKERETKQKEWVLIDASNCVLGKIAVKTATILMGKNKPHYTPHMDMGAYVIIVNAKEVVLTGKKWKNKKYYRHSGYPGGLKTTTAKEMRKKKPEQIVIHAVKGMLPKNKLGAKMIKKLKVYPDENHPHIAQKPILINIEKT